MSEESPLTMLQRKDSLKVKRENEETDAYELHRFQLRRTWEIRYVLNRVFSSALGSRMIHFYYVNVHGIFSECTIFNSSPYHTNGAIR